MRAHYLQHVPFEGPGSIESWLQQTGYKITSTPLYEFSTLPEVKDIDLLIIMGGPMSVNDEQSYPWLTDELDFIKSVIEAGIPTLGICLGAQLIAKSLGANIGPNAVSEIGWFPVFSCQNSDRRFFRFPLSTDVFHWHGETFDLPDGAVKLAESKACKNQAFQFNTHVIGLQFHLETTASSAQDIVNNCRHELINGEFIQTEEDILSVTEDKYTAKNKLMTRVLEHLTRTKQ